MYLDKNTPLRTLVVDDNEDAAVALALLLELWGCDVRVAGSGDDALTAAHAFGPDAMLMDIGMPGMSGYETARRWRAIEKSEGRQPAMMAAVTGYGSKSDAEAALRAGFDYHFVKPTDASHLHALLEDFASRRRSRSVVCSASERAHEGWQQTWTSKVSGASKAVCP